ncbi:MAG: glycine cleavage system protein GcvH [Alphaproteobacteria bacterium]|jgi:glycine cleavage system H protein|nr:glycine cleavage system protein GcvH [Alphaproteobacteria bacterium]|tara:strand:+ start:361 stop:747 length:387 start_codon:yes stop_codon:yes gene_type:complete
MSAVRFTEDHEWIRLDDDDDGTGFIGISDYAQEQLGDIVFVELPEIGTVLTQGDEASVIESVKAASEIYAPVDGEIVAVNERLVEDPSLVNSDALGEGWFIRLRITDAGQLDGLMDEATYQDFVEDLE